MNLTEFAERLPTLYTLDPKTGCWLWAMQVNDNGYGRVHIDDRKRSAHRVVYETLVGPVPEGLDLDHLCRVRCCVNPEHLEPVTRSENLLRGDMLSRWLDRTHCRRGHALTEDNVRRYGNARACKTCARENLRKSRLNRRGGVPAQPLNKDKTHCKRGHPLSGENLAVGVRGERNCRTCKRETLRASRARRKEEHTA